MKRLPAPFERKLNYPKIFLDDLVEIEEIIIKELKTDKYKIVAENFEYSSVKEIPKKNKPIHELKIIVEFSTLSLYLTGYAAHLSADGNNLSAIGAAQKIFEIISVRERKIFGSSFKLSAFLFFALSIAAFAGFIFITSNNLGMTYYLIILLAVLLAIYSAWYGINFPFNHFSEINLINRDERPAFIEKYKDQIFLSLINLVIGAVFGILGTLIINKINGT